MAYTLNKSLCAFDKACLKLADDILPINKYKSNIDYFISVPVSESLTANIYNWLDGNYMLKVDTKSLQNKIWDYKKVQEPLTIRKQWKDSFYEAIRYQGFSLMKYLRFEAYESKPHVYEILIRDPAWYLRINHYSPKTRLI